MSLRNGTEYWGVYENATLDELKSLPVLTQGWESDLLIQTDNERVWLARTTVEDGEPWDNHVAVERLIAGSWIVVEHWEAR